MSDIKTEKTIAEELKAAAAKVRDLGKAAPPGPWGVNGPWWWDVSHYEQDITSCIVTDPGNEPVAVLAPPYNRHENAEQAAPWIRMMNPLLAEPLAAWLEKTAKTFDDEVRGHLHDTCDGALGQDCYCFREALVVARVLNGTTERTGS